MNWKVLQRPLNGTPPVVSLEQGTEALKVALALLPLLNNKEMECIAVIGSGTMGNGIAHVFAQRGYKVQLVDISREALENGITTIGKNLDRNCD